MATYQLRLLARQWVEIVVATRMRPASGFKHALQELPIGEKVGLDGPFGSLTLQSNSTRPAVFLAGGIGITPFISMLRQVTREGLPHRIVLFYSNRRPQDAAFLEELTGLAGENPNITLVATMTNAAASEWNGERGRIETALLRKCLPDSKGPIYSIAGPPAFVAAMREMLEQAGITDDDIRSEDFLGY